jgi:hypothetical protein
MIQLIPQLNGGEGNKIFKIELLNTINGMGIKMEAEEFDKLWKKYPICEVSKFRKLFMI